MFGTLSTDYEPTWQSHKNGSSQLKQSGLKSAAKLKTLGPKKAGDRQRFRQISYKHIVIIVIIFNVGPRIDRRGLEWEVDMGGLGIRGPDMGDLGL